ncbi:hypothetical protein ACSLBF_17195 [Pseudoalteromonas sp. T1lg65]|uniref:hypothetical protein n=1 Tax=Pseudoalteromonas sp. T1lg65 TaxID=2077101 RepID=UPI003F790049
MFTERTKKYGAAINHVLKYEVEVFHLYLNVDGIPTIGINYQVPNAERFCQLPLKDRKSKRNSTMQQRLDEHKRIRLLPRGYRPSWYAAHTKLTLSPQVTRELLREQFERYEKKLGNYLDSRKGLCIPYKKLPAPAKTALLDMAFSLDGVEKLITGFPELFDAIQAQDWEAASEVCVRKNTSPSRNEATKKLFLDCQKFPKYRFSLLDKLSDLIG